MQHFSREREKREARSKNKHSLHSLHVLSAPMAREREFQGEKFGEREFEERNSGRVRREREKVAAGGSFGCI